VLPEAIKPELEYATARTKCRCPTCFRVQGVQGLGLRVEVSGGSGLKFERAKWRFPTCFEVSGGSGFRVQGRGFRGFRVEA
jgi:hypothetical protein